RYGLGPDAYPSVRRDHLPGRRGEESDRLVTVRRGGACGAQHHRQAQCCCCQCSHCLPPSCVPEAPTPRGVHASCCLSLASFIRCENLGRPFATIIDLLSPPRDAPPVVDTPAGALKCSAVRQVMSLQGSQAAAVSWRARMVASIDAVRCCVTRVVPSHVQLHGGRHEGLCGVWFLVGAG